MASIIAQGFKLDTHEQELFVTQSAFRAVMDAMARPGQLRRISAICYPGSPPSQLPSQPSQPSQPGQPGYAGASLKNGYLETLVCMLVDSSCKIVVYAADSAPADADNAAGTDAAPAESANAAGTDAAQAATDNAAGTDAAPVGADACVAAICARTYALPSTPDKASFAIITKDAAPRQGAGLLAMLSGGSDASPELGATAVIECDALAADQRPSAGCRFKVSGPGVRTEQFFAASSGWWLAARDSRKDEFPCGIDLILVDTSGNVVALPRTAQIAVCGKAAAEEMPPEVAGQARNDTGRLATGQPDAGGGHKAVTECG